MNGEIDSIQRAVGTLPSRLAATDPRRLRFDHLIVVDTTDDVQRRGCPGAAVLRGAEHVRYRTRSRSTLEHHGRTAGHGVNGRNAQGPDAAIHVGRYLHARGNELVLGPFLGKPSPHTTIPLGRGICGAAATERATIIVDDVNSDPRYLACSIDTRSEIVVPIMRDDQVLGEIDIDSDIRAAFGPEDPTCSRRCAAILSEKL